MNKLLHLLKKLLRIRFWYTLYFNFRYLPFKQALTVPIIFFNRARIQMEQGGRVIVSCLVKQRIRIGDYQLNFSYGKEHTTITNRGVIDFHGGSIRIQAGGVWYVQGEVHLHEDTMFGNNTMLSCYKRVEIGAKSRIAHECQVRDCNFHYLRDTITGEAKPISSPVIIGSSCWIGNRTTIMPGTVLPDSTIVGSNSLLNKDYSKIIELNSLIAGMPAKFIRGNIERVSFVDPQLEKELFNKEFSFEDTDND